jgi:hypothetical protein
MQQKQRKNRERSTVQLRREQQQFAEKLLSVKFGNSKSCKGNTGSTPESAPPVPPAAQPLRRPASAPATAPAREMETGECTQREQRGQGEAPDTHNPVDSDIIFHSRPPSSAGENPHRDGGGRRGGFRLKKRDPLPGSGGTSSRAKLHLRKNISGTKDGRHDGGSGANSSSNRRSSNPPLPTSAATSGLRLKKRS